MDIGSRLKKLRLEMKLTLEEAGSKIGLSKQTLHKYENGIILNIPSDKIELLAKMYGSSPAYIMGWEDDVLNIPNIYKIKTKKFPMLGEIAAGTPILAVEDFESYVEAGADIVADFCLKAKGDSMIGARIMDGDIVFIREQPDVNDGEIAAVIIEDEATLKRVYKGKNEVTLVAENPAYRPMVYRNEELNNIHILGKAIAFQSDIS